VPQAQRAPSHQTVTIFDWDDTLLCTSCLERDERVKQPPSVEQHLRSIERAATQLLEQAMEVGHVFIITNAQEGWVEYSAARWIPGLLPVLERVPIISARTLFEKQYPGEQGKWKVCAFFEMQKKLPGDLLTNLLSVGDSQYEMDAVHAVATEFEESIVKTIKLKAKPKPVELLKQLELLSGRFQKIAEHGCNLKIVLERKQAVA